MPTKVVSESETEHRFLSVLFCDLEDSTGHQYRMEPEDFAALLSGYRHLAFEAISRHGGHTARVIGDGVLAYFGWPRGGGRDAEAAVSCALAIGEAFAGLAEQLADATDRPLAVRMAVETGWVLVGNLANAGAPAAGAAAAGVSGAGGDGAPGWQGGHALEQGDVIGHAPNVAARLQRLARPNGVVAGEATLALLGERFELEAVDTSDLALPAPVRAARVVRRAPGSEALLRLGIGQDRLLMGRDRELAFLLARWREVQAGRGQVVLISGDPGIGKSALAASLVAEVRAAPAPGAAPPALLVLTCTQATRHSVLQPLAEPLRQLLEGPATAGSGEIAAAAARLAGRLAMPAGGGGIAATLGMAAPGLEPAALRTATFEAVLALAATLSRDRPLLVLAEDLQWADASTLEVLGLLAERLAGLAIMLVATHHAGWAPGWPPAANRHTLALAPLSGEAAAALLDAVGGGLDGEVRAAILARSEGNPFFVREFARNLAQERLARESQAGAAQAGAAQAGATQAGAIQAGATQAGATGAGAVQAGAKQADAGRAGTDRPGMDGAGMDGAGMDRAGMDRARTAGAEAGLRGQAPPGPARAGRAPARAAPRLPGSISQLLAARLDSAGSARFLVQFISVVGRDVEPAFLALLSGLPQDELARELERLIGLGILAYRGEAPGGRVGFHHALLAAASYEALTSLRRQTLHRRVAEALPDYDPAIRSSEPEVLARHLALAGEDEAAGELFQAAAARALASAAFVESAAHARRALELAEGLAGEARARARLAGTVLLAEALSGTEGYASNAVHALFESANRIALELGGAADLMQPALRGLTAFYQLRGPLHRAYELGRRTVQVARLRGDALQLAEAERRWGWCRFCQGELEEARLLVESAMMRIERFQAGHPEAALVDDTAVRGPVVLGLVAWFVDGDAAATAMAGRLAERARAFPQPMTAAYGLGFAAVIEQLCGHPAEALSCAQHCGEIARGRSSPYWAAVADVIAGWCAVVAGEAPERGMTLLRRGVEDYAATQSLIMYPYALMLRADAERALGAADSALATLREALECAEAIGAGVYRSLLDAARAGLLMRADPPAAHAALARARSLCRQQGALAQLQRLDSVR